MSICYHSTANYSERHVYFVKPVGLQGPIKIGSSANLKKRVQSMSSHSPLPLELITSIYGNVFLELRFHALFLPSRSHGEWFSWTQHLQDTINAICAGTFDISLLPEPKGLPWAQARKANLRARRNAASLSRGVSQVRAA